MYKRFHRGLVAFGETLNIDLSPTIKGWSQIYESRYKYRGKADAVKFMKELNTVVERYALHQAITPIPWTISSNDGYPKILNFCKEALRSEDRSTVILTLSVFRAVEDLRLPVSHDISSVTEPCSFDTDTLNSIIRFIPEWLKKFRPLKLPRMKYHLTIKNGPNGHALKESDKDILAVMMEPSIYGAIRIVEDKLRDTRPMLETFSLDEDVYLHSKLTQFSEKAGKTRTIAIIDYYSQRCLKPLHEGLMTFLRNLISDGTYSHQNVGKFAMQCTQDKSYVLCTDLTAATDRFPAEIQRVLLFELLKDHDLADALWTLLAKRTFTTSWSGENVTYSCGQPMGAYASWPLFALAHHLVVEYCANEVNTSIKQSYRLIGDDNIINDRKTAELYLSVMTKLGLTINQSKTVISLERSEFSSAEIAKQLYLNGKCLTPMTPGFIRDIRKPYMFNTCIGILIDRYEFFSPETPSILIEKFFRKERARRLVWLLASNPINGNIKPSYKGYDVYCPWEADKLPQYEEDYRKIVINALIEQAQSNADNIIDDLDDFGGGEIDFLDFDSFDLTTLSDNYIASGAMKESLWKDSTRPQPQCYSEIRFSIESQLTEIINELGNLSTQEPLESLVAKFDYVPDPTLPYMTRKEMRNRRMSSVIEKLYKYDGSITFNTIDW